MMSHLYSRPITELKSALTETCINNAIRWWRACLIPSSEMGGKVIKLQQHLDSATKSGFIETYEFYLKKNSERERRIKHEADSIEVLTPSIGQ